jgi:hypothetical protein
MPLDKASHAVGNEHDLLVAPKDGMRVESQAQIVGEFLN